MDAKKAPKKKPSSGGNLRPPAVKRSNQAPVTLQGWLWKQGSDGLMRWKKRWFVLSDFCLFYYKGPEEDKVLGSILLPSYVISPCANENRALRKFSFKAEHQNMRTYYFAADTKESLHQWMNAMSLATILQRDGRYEDHHDSSHCSESHNTSTANEDEDSGFTSYHSKRYLGSPHQDENSPMNSSYTSDSLHPEERYRDTPNNTSHSSHERNADAYLGNTDKYPASYGGHPHYHRNSGSRQHVYATAPPKPRRLGNPDCYGTNNNNYSSPDPVTYNNGEVPNSEYSELREDGPPPEYSVGPTNKGGNPTTGNKEQIHRYKVKKDDIYIEKEWSPQNMQTYSGNYAAPQEKRDYSDSRSLSTSNGHSDQRITNQPPTQVPDACRYQDDYDPAILREKGQRIFNAQRPHSANFLEYEAHIVDGTYSEDPSLIRRRNKENNYRPKSSIEHYNHPEYWKDSMAVQYNQQIPPHTPHTHTNSQVWNNSLYSAASPQVELSQSPNPRNERNIQNWDGSRHPNRYPINECYADSKYVTSVETLSPRQTMQMRAVSRDPYFMRSASARLPSTVGGHVHPPDGLPAYAQDDIVDHDPKHAQQREESMKRLLEWKQRMLQSPFTKKYPPTKNLLQDSAEGNQKKISQEEYRKQAFQEIVHHENNRQFQHNPKPHKEKINYEKDYHKKFDPTVKHEENKNEIKPKLIERSEIPSNNSPAPRIQPPVQPLPRNLVDGKPIHPKLNQFRSSYSSDDEESGSGSLKGQFNSRTQPQHHSKDVLREEPMSSEAEFQKHDIRGLKLTKYHLPDNYNSNSIRMNISAGDLLGKTHEELILLLIQLRRTQARLQKAIDTCRLELEGERKLMHIDSKNREMHSRKVQELTIQLEEYTKQLEMSKPLVNLVDNMVKLGSLYGGSERIHSSQYHLSQQSPEQYAPPKTMIEFTRQLQEQRHVQETLMEWNQLVPDQRNLQNKLQHLYQLDRALQEESAMLSNLQQDKEMLERALTGIQAKAIENQENLLEQERLQKQQHLVERELGKVQIQLINTTKKLEETAAENAKIEHEIMMLRQKIQQTLRKTPNSQGNAVPEDTETRQLKKQLEEELAHVQSIMDELSKRRHEISGTVQQLKAGGKLLREIRPSPTGVSGSAALPGRKLHRSTYLETDLDTMETRDVLDSVHEEDEEEEEEDNVPQLISQQKPFRAPIYENSDNIGTKGDAIYTGHSLLAYVPDQREVKEFMDEQDELHSHQDINDADERMKRFYGILPREKPSEIKTVRIVKRESERRNKSKDRRKVTNDDEPLMRVIEESDSINLDDFEYLDEIHLSDFQRSMSLPRNYGRVSYVPGYPVQPPSDLALVSASSPASATTNKILPNVPYYYRTPNLSHSERFVSAHERLFGNNPSPPTVTPLENISSNPLATPVFKSEAARQIVAETAQQFMATLTGGVGDDLHLNMDTPSHEKGSLKRRHKRRHYTISSSQPLILETTSPKLVHARSRDDLDMERCLRSSNTPDVVKSTIKKSENFDESTIDRELGLPQKIVIPERYVEQEEEELTAEEKLHRLQKAEAIKKMLSETTTYGDLSESEIANASETLKKKFEQEKKQREQLLSLNQQLAQEVKERSKVVAAITSPRQINPPPSQIS